MAGLDDLGKILYPWKSNLYNLVDKLNKVEHRIEFNYETETNKTYMQVDFTILGRNVFLYPPYPPYTYIIPWT